MNEWISPAPSQKKYVTSEEKMKKFKEIASRPIKKRDERIRIKSETKKTSDPSIEKPN